jgi:hypothetical protein
MSARFTMLRACQFTFTLLAALFPERAFAGGKQATGWDQPRPEIMLRDTTLERALNQLGEMANSTVVVDWDALYDAGVARDEDVNLSLREVTPRKALRLVLDLVGSRRNARLVADDEGRFLLISTDAGLSREATVRVYDCRDLLAPKLGDELQRRIRDAVAAANEVDAAGLELPFERKTTSGPSGSLVTEAVARDPQREPSRAVRVYNEMMQALEYDLHERQAAALIAIIQKNVDPASWGCNGGKVGTLTVMNDLLVIKQIHPNHAEIARLLATLRTDRQNHK